MNDIKKFYNQDVKLFSKAYASYISKIVTQLDFIAIEKLAKSLLKARKNNNQIFLLETVEVQVRHLILLMIWVSTF